MKIDLLYIRKQLLVMEVNNLNKLIIKDCAQRCIDALERIIEEAEEPDEDIVH